VLRLTCDARVLEHPPGEVDRLADLGDVSGASGASVDVPFEEAAVPIVERVVEMQRHQLDGLGAADVAAGVNRLVRTPDRTSVKSLHVGRHRLRRTSRR
jgi:hypothetical protein